MGFNSGFKGLSVKGRDQMKGLGVHWKIAVFLEGIWCGLNVAGCENLVANFYEDNKALHSMKYDLSNYSWFPWSTGCATILGVRRIQPEQLSMVSI